MPEEKKDEEIELDLKKIRFDNKYFIALIIAAVIAFFYFLFGFLGVKIIAGAFLLYFLPFYLILGKFGLETEEKLIFSFFIGLGVVSTMTYFLGKVLNSLRLGAVLTFALLIISAIILRKEELMKLIKRKESKP